MLSSRKKMMIRNQKLKDKMTIQPPIKIVCLCWLLVACMSSESPKPLFMWHIWLAPKIKKRRLSTTQTKKISFTVKKIKVWVFFCLQKRWLSFYFSLQTKMMTKMSARPRGFRKSSFYLRQKISKFDVWTFFRLFRLKKAITSD